VLLRVDERRPEDARVERLGCSVWVCVAMWLREEDPRTGYGLTDAETDACLKLYARHRENAPDGTRS
jgi:hypothetical protein